MVEDCDHMMRLLLALKYYEKLDGSKHPEKERIFSEFVGSVYGEVLNDWIHFMTTHSGHQMEDIHDALSSSKREYGGGCGQKEDGEGVASCSLFRRHHDGDRQNKHIGTSSDDEESRSEERVRAVFLGELFDRIHHFLYHLFDSALRTRTDTVHGLGAKHDDDDDEDEHSKDGGYALIDRVFAEKRRALNERKEALKTLSDRFDDSKHSKFNIATVGNGGGNGDDKTKRIPFIDALFERLKQRNCPRQWLYALTAAIISGEYDTDSIVEDLSLRGTASNVIAAAVGDKQSVRELLSFVEEMKCLFMLFVLTVFAHFLLSELVRIETIHSVSHRLQHRNHVVLLEIVSRDVSERSIRSH